MTRAEINKNFKYVKDSQKWGFLDVWTANLEGDCEDYCILLKDNVDEFKDWDYYYCKINGNGHCILKKDNKVIDCNTKYIINIDEYSKLYNMTDLKKYNKIVVFIKILFGKIYTKIKGVK